MAHLIIDEKTGRIVNHHVGGHPSWSAPDGHKEVEFDGPFDIGWLWDGDKAIDPNAKPPPVKRTGVRNVIG